MHFGATERYRGQPVHDGMFLTPEIFNVVAFEAREYDYDFYVAHAFEAYKTLVPEDLIEHIEKMNLHHGFSHIRRVMNHLRQSMLDPELFHNKTTRANFSEFVPAATLAARMHDTIQQYMDSQPEYEARSKFLHDKIGALYFMLFAPELKKTFGYSLKDIYFTASMVYHHSEPEDIAHGKGLPSFAELRNDLKAEIAKDTKGGIPKNLLDFIPLSQQLGIDHEELERRLNDDNHFVAPELVQEERDGLDYYSLRLSMADKFDSLFPSSLANRRTLDTSWAKNRRLYVDFDQEVALSVLDERMKQIQKSNMKEQKKSYELGRLDSLKEEVAKYEGQDLPVSLEFQIRLIAGNSVDKDDVSRVVYEMMRDYNALGLTDYETAKVAQDFENRGNDLIHIGQHMSGEIDDADLEAFVQSHQNPDLKRITAVQQQRLQLIAQEAIKRIKVIYKDTSGMPKIDPLAGKSYEVGSTTRDQAGVIYTTKKYEAMAMLHSPDLTRIAQ